MRRFFTLATLVLVAFATACRDGTQTVAPTGPAAAGARQAIVPGTCTTLGNLTALVNTVFGGGPPNANSALGKLDNIAKSVAKGKIADAQGHANSLIDFIVKKAADGGLAGTPAQVQTLIGALRCFVGLSSNTFLIYPSDLAQIILHPTGLAGVSLQGNTVGTPSLLTIELLDPNGPSPLDTKLDKYPEFIQLTLSTPLTKPAIVGICPALSVPTSVLPHLRIGHQASTGFELTPRADASFLNCAAIAQSTAPSWINRLASVLLPKDLYAKQDALERGGGVGGTATEFSPFGPVDEELRAGGVGGTSTEFQRTPNAPTLAPAKLAPGAPSASRIAAPTARSTALSVTCPAAEALIGTAVTPDCRPALQITTNNGTVMQNVPVNWAINLGGGTIAPQDLQSATCGATFGSTAATVTDVNGKASVCWTLGGSVGLNTVIATPTAGGDAPVGVTFAPNAQSFSATAVAAPAVATAGSGTMLLGGTVPSLPCVVTGLLAGDAGAVTCTTAVPASLVAGPNTTTPVVSPANPPNYSVQLVNGALTVRYAKTNCFASPVHGALPPTSSFQTKGSVLLVKCSLQTAQGTTVTNASGNLVVSDRGTDGLGSPVVILSLNNAFARRDNAYSYSLDTSPVAFISGHYYELTAQWSDGSTTTGYIYVN